MNFGESEVVWLANRENPLADSSGLLNINPDGNLEIIDGRGTLIIVNSERPAMNSNTSVTILDSGNLVLRAGESFDYPTDKFLAGMKLGLFGLKTGQPRNRLLTSWRSSSVPAPGASTLGVDPNNTKQIVIWRREVRYWSSGIWNGHNFSSFLRMDEFNFSYVSHENERYFTFTVREYSHYSWIGIESSGMVQRHFGEGSWSRLPCLGHSPYSSEGCVMPEPSKCGGRDVFAPTRASSDYWHSFVNSSLGLSD